VTDEDDLTAFWRGMYPKVKAELSRRYPRHVWRWKINKTPPRVFGYLPGEWLKNTDGQFEKLPRA